MEVTIGEIRLFAGNFVPSGWLLCNGQVLEISKHNLLYTMLGNKYAGDGRTTFGLPKIQPLGAETATPFDDINYIICCKGMLTSRPY